MRKVCTAWEFRHDQMPAFVAASALVKDKPNFDQLIRFIDDGRALALPVGDQATLWEFIAALSVRDGDLVSLWTDAREDANPFGKPSDPDLSLWIGPFALQWLAEDNGRCVKQDREAVVMAVLDRGAHPTGGCASMSG